MGLAPPGGVPLELLEHRDVVERPVAARAEERRPLRRDPPGQPQPPDRERRRRPDAGHGLPPRRTRRVVAARARGRGDHAPQADRVERQHDGIRLEPVLVVVAGHAVQHREAVAELAPTERTSRPVTHRDARGRPGARRAGPTGSCRSRRAARRRAAPRPSRRSTCGTSRPARRRRTRAGRRRSCGRTPRAPGAGPPRGSAAGRARRRRSAPSSAAKVAGKSTSSSPSAASTSTAARPLRSKLGLRATNAGEVPRRGARDVRRRSRARRRRAPAGSRRAGAAAPGSGRCGAARARRL